MRRHVTREESAQGRGRRAAWVGVLPLIACCFLAPATAAAASLGRHRAVPLAPSSPFLVPPLADQSLGTLGATLAQRAAIAAAARGSVYAGSTAQDDPAVIQLSRAGTRLTKVTIFWEARCASGQTFVLGMPMTVASSPPSFIGPGQNILVSTRLDKKGRFKGTALGSVTAGNLSFGLVQHVSGKLGAKSASGAFDAHVDVNDTSSPTVIDTCDSGRISWRAPSPQSLYYGGASSQGQQPVVIQLRPSRKSVKTFRIGWLAPCTPDGAMYVGDAWDDFKINRAGRFGGNFFDNEPDGSGGFVRFDLQLRGKVGATRASGTFHMLVTSTDSSGAVTRSCNTPAIRWTAKQ